MRKYTQECPVARALDVIGDRWTILILRDMFMGATRFGDFLEASPGLPPKLLSARLKTLKDQGFVDRRIYSLHPLRAEYLLTDKGRSFLPIVLEIGRWGFSYAFEGDSEARSRVAETVYHAIPESRAMIEAGGFISGK